jgi:HEAT repeat protein
MSMFRYSAFIRTVAGVGFVVAASGCQPTPKPVVTGVQAGKTYVGVDPAADTIAADAKVSMARPVLPATTAQPATAGSASPRVTVQYQSPSLERPLSDVPDQELAAEALARIGSPAVPSLVQALTHRDPLVRREATRVLMRMGPDAKTAAPELTRLLDDEDELVRKYAAKAIANIGPDAAVAVPALMLDLLRPTPEAPRQNSSR